MLDKKPDHADGDPAPSGNGDTGPRKAVMLPEDPAVDALPLIEGVGSKASPLVKDLLSADTRADSLSAALKANGTYKPKAQRVPLSRYYDPEFAALEMEHVWKKEWQYACREEDIPEVGDRTTYTVGTLSFVIVRSAKDEIKAFYNTCLHRGTRLCEGAGSGAHLTCPFHGWKWNPDGTLHEIPSDWDFPQVERDKEKFALAEVKLDTWGGFVFINPDPDAGPLEDALGVMPEHFKTWEYENRFTAVHLRRKVHANWKITMEAFLEAYHVIETHPQALPFTGDSSTQYDIWDDGKSHISRLYTPLGVPSPHLGDEADVNVALQGLAQVMALAAGEGVEPAEIKSLATGRADVAEWRRQTMGAALGRDFTHLSDADLVDTIQYMMFPNFCPWYGEGLPLVYRFLPAGDDPNWSWMEIRLMAPVPGGGAPRPPAAPIQELDESQDFTSEVETIGILSTVFDQDMGNLPSVQQGTQALEEDIQDQIGSILKVQQGVQIGGQSHQYAVLGRYQESRITHFHEVLSKKMGLPLDG